MYRLRLHDSATERPDVWVRESLWDWNLKIEWDFNTWRWEFYRVCLGCKNVKADVPGPILGALLDL